MSKKSRKRAQKQAKAAQGFRTSESETQGSIISESEDVNLTTPGSDISGEADDSLVHAKGEGEAILGGGLDESVLNAGFLLDDSKESIDNISFSPITSDLDGTCASVNGQANANGGTNGNGFWISDWVNGTIDDVLSGHAISDLEESSGMMDKDNEPVVTNNPNKEGNSRRNSKTMKEIPHVSASPALDQFNSVTLDECPHMVKSMSMAGLRKAFKGDVKPICSPCTFTKEKPKVDKKWVCLQCGHISCGDQNAENGDAMKHFKTPRNNLHAIVVELGDDYRCWCFLCQSEVNSKNAKVKDGVVLVKKTVKGKLASSIADQKAKEEDEIAGRGIPALPAPPPLPPAPPIQRQYSGNGKKKGIGKADQSNFEFDNNRPLGLDNLGNTCFMNATLQCLSRTKLLLPKLDLFGSGENISVLVTPTEDQVKMTVLNSSQEIIKNDGEPAENAFAIPEIQQGDGDEIELKSPFIINLNFSSESMTARLKHTLNAITRRQDTHAHAAGDSNTAKPGVSRPQGKFRPTGVHSMISKNFRAGLQHDSHELLRTIVDMMKKDQTKAFRAAIMKKFGVAKGGEASDPKMVELVKILDQKAKHQTFVDEIFGGELMTTQTCLICKSVRRFHEDFLDLSLPVIGANTNTSTNTSQSNQKNNSKNHSENENAVTNHTVEECLIAFTAPELLIGSNVVECDTCHRINLEKYENGAAFEDAFPNATPITKSASEPSSSNKVNEGTEKKDCGNKRQVERKKKRPSRQSRIHAQAAASSAAAAQNESSPSDESVTAVAVTTTTTENDNCDEIPPLVSDSETDQEIGPSQDAEGLTEATLPLPDNENDLDRDSDLPSALDGVGGNASSDCGGSSSNENDVTSTTPGLDLPLYDKFNFFQAPDPQSQSSESQLTDVTNTTVLESGMKDEGYSDGSGENEIGTVTVERRKPPPNSKCPCSRQQFISRPPEFLTIHLKRFQASGRGTSKLNHHIAFPLRLDLTRFCSSESDATSTQIFDEDGKVMYKLYGFVEHSGSIHWGHYVAYVKVSNEGQGQGQGGGSKDNWYYASDTHITHCTESQIPSKDPYILFYERVRRNSDQNDCVNGKLEMEVGRVTEEVAEVSLYDDNQEEKMDTVDSNRTTTGNNVVIVISPPEEDDVNVDEI